MVACRYLGGQASAYTGQDIVKESDYGVVTVIIQYRLGVFGFLPGAEVKANGSLNAGLREWMHARIRCVWSSLYGSVDQNFALQWVQKHVGHLLFVPLYVERRSHMLLDRLLWRRPDEGRNLGRIRWCRVCHAARYSTWRPH